MIIPGNLYLIGPMGSGKTSVGKQLAALTNKTFIDSDAEIEQQTGVNIAWIFEKEQEAGFRKREAAVIAELTQQKNLIISTGGGSILSATTRQRLKATGTIIFLKVSLNTQLERINRRKGTRPLIQGSNPREKLAAINKEREEIYAALADITIETDHLNAKEVAQTILTALTERLGTSDLKDC